MILLHVQLIGNPFPDELRWFRRPESVLKYLRFEVLLELPLRMAGCQSTQGVYILPRPDQVANEVVQKAVREPLLQEHECSLDRKPFPFEVGILAGELLAEVMEGGVLVGARRHPILLSHKVENEVDSTATPFRIVAEKTPEIPVLEAFLQGIPFVGNPELQRPR